MCLCVYETNKHVCAFRDTFVSSVSACVCLCKHISADVHALCTRCIFLFVFPQLGHPEGLRSSIT